MEHVIDNVGSATVQQQQDGNYKFEIGLKTLILTPAEAHLVSEAYLQVQHTEEMERLLMKQLRIPSMKEPR